ncbi:unnamed protein product [Symbiodinium necroappetens]|uniref:Uncharacterized protein n=1 Tax=Symbiodinium necroappetens TaxID=1628268 RepID=A0A812U7N7_9DINO|nr:unnamed protein product [Symbiodinium necroappetens]
MIAAGWQWATATKNIRRNKVHGEEEAKLVLDDAFEAMDKTTNETSMQGEMDVQDDSGFLLENDIPDIDGSDAAITNGQADGAAAASSAQERLSKAGGTRAETLRDQLETILSNMRGLFEKLTQKQSESLTPFSDSLLRLFAETTKQDLIMNNYVVRAKSVKGGAGSSTDKPKKEKKEKDKPKAKKPGKKDNKNKKDKGLLNNAASSESDSGSEEGTDDDLADELLVGFEAGANTLQAVKLAIASGREC